MKNPKAKTALKVVHRNDRAQTKRVLAGSGQALLPMLERLEGAQASIDELIHETAVALAERQLRVQRQRLHDKNGRDVSQLCCPAAAGTAGSPRARCPGASPKPVPRSWPHSTSAAWLSCPCWCWPSSRRWLQWRYARRTVLRAAATWNARRSGRVRTVERARLPPGRPDPCVDRAP